MATKTAAWTIVGLVVAGIIVAAGVVYSGLLNVSALAAHSAPAQWLLHTTMVHSVKRRAAGIQVPPLDDPKRIQAGFGDFNDMCVACHGAPGVERSEIGLGLMPRAPDLAKAAARWSPNELFWILKHGVKMTGMPAFGPTHEDEELWTIVSFVRQLPHVSAAEYQALVARAESMPSGHGHGHGQGAESETMDHSHHDD